MLPDWITAGKVARHERLADHCDGGIASRVAFGELAPREQRGSHRLEVTRPDTGEDGCVVVGHWLPLRDYRIGPGGSAQRSVGRNTSRQDPRYPPDVIERLLRKRDPPPCQVHEQHAFPF